MSDKEYEKNIDTMNAILFLGGFLLILAIIFLLSKKTWGETMYIIAIICGIMSLWCFMVGVHKKDHAIQMRSLSKIERRLTELEKKHPKYSAN